MLLDLLTLMGGRSAQHQTPFSRAFSRLMSVGCILQQQNTNPNLVPARHEDVFLIFVLIILLSWRY